jgi:protein-disulfide isomerase
VLTVEPEIIERYVRPGSVKLVFRAVLNYAERSLRASEAAACAGRQDRFWQMHEVLFEKQGDTWATDNDGLVELMLGFGRQIDGLDQDAFAACLADRSTLDALTAADAEQRGRGITAQPIFELGAQRLFGYQPVDRMAAAIEEELN